jgi:hypothetical protein
MPSLHTSFWLKSPFHRIFSWSLFKSVWTDVIRKLQTGWFKQQEFISHSSGDGSLRSGWQPGQVLMRAFLLVHRWRHSCSMLTWKKGSWERNQALSHHEGSKPHDFITSQCPISKHHHIGDRVSAYGFGGEHTHTHSVPSTMDSV